MKPVCWSCCCLCTETSMCLFGLLWDLSDNYVICVLTKTVSCVEHRVDVGVHWSHLIQYSYNMLLNGALNIFKMCFICPDIVKSTQEASDKLTKWTAHVHCLNLNWLRYWMARESSVKLSVCLLGVMGAKTRAESSGVPPRQKDPPDGCGSRGVWAVECECYWDTVQGLISHDRVTWAIQDVWC